MAQLPALLCFLPLFTICASSLSAQTISRASTAVAIDVKLAELLAKLPLSNWLSYNGDYTGRRCPIGCGPFVWWKHDYIGRSGLFFGDEAQSFEAVDAPSGRPLTFQYRPDLRVAHELCI